ncbi:cell wall-active antibiotics response protein LiaF [Streptococcus suis]|uniref:cell wall-active antibiotics response protein LiaF n=1 Tax=Streptococcus suis TaxID=1307 RepID=UPI002155F66A|nr:cell wall-active antibiotics response protein LiaF [Streptococcus suis]
MRKVQFFLLIESMIFTMAAFDVVANEASRTLLLFSALLLVIWYFLGRKVNSVLLVSSLSLLFLVFVLNPFFIIGIMLLVVYMLINFFSRYEKRNQYTHIVFSDYSLQVQKEKNRWFGNHDHSQDRFGFEDINIVRLFGNDVVDLDKTVLVGRDNIVVIRKTFGRTKIIVPIDVEVALSATSIYGRVSFLGESYDIVIGQYPAAGATIDGTVTLYVSVASTRTSSDSSAGSSTSTSTSTGSGQ